MASYTDIVPQFREYVPQLPVEAMVKVGMEKQKRYDEGIQKVQSYIDNVAGLNISKEIHKQYTQSKLNELGNNLRTIAAGDFSNAQLVNSVGGMTKQIIKDPVIQNAVSSTNQMLKGDEYQESERKAGKSSPDNEFRWKKRKLAWLNDGDLNSQFSESYIPYFDVFKYAKETFDAVKPDGMTWDQVFQLDANGNPMKDAKGNLIYSPVMTRISKEGIFPEKVKQTLGQIFSDPRVSQQLAITGEYNYRNYGKEELSKKLVDQRDEVLERYEDALVVLNGQKKAGKDVQADIDNLESKIKQVKEGYDSYMSALETNEDFVRGALYKDDVNSRYMEMFTNVKKSETVMENPHWRTSFEMQKEANALSKWAQEFKYTKERDRIKDAQWLADYEQRERKGDGKKKPTPGGYGTPTGPGEKIPTQADQPSDIDIEYQFDRDLTNATNEFVNSSTTFIWENGGFSKIAKNQDFIKKVMDSGRASTKEQAIQLAFEDIANRKKISVAELLTQFEASAVTNYNSMTPEQRSKNPLMETQYLAYKKSRKNYEGILGVQKKVDKQWDKETGALKNKLDALGTIPDIQPVVYDGKSLTLSKEDIINISDYVLGRGTVAGFQVPETTRRKSNAAYQRLKVKGLDDLADYMLDRTRTGLSVGQVLKQPLTSIYALGKMAFKSQGPGAINLTTTEPLFKQIKEVIRIQASGGDYDRALSTRANIIRNAYSIKPNLKVGILIGDKGTDDDTIYTIGGYAGAYATGQVENLSPDFSEFAEGIATFDRTKNKIEAQIVKDVNGNSVVELVLYGEGSKRVGGMTIQEDEALGLNLDINTLYEPREISILRNVMNNNGGVSSNNDPSEKSTYINGDAWIEKDDIPAASKTGYDVKANFRYQSGIYTPYVYVSDGYRSKVRELPGSKTLGEAVGKVTSLDPTFLNLILTEK